MSMGSYISTMEAADPISMESYILTKEAADPICMGSYVGEVRRGKTAEREMEQVNAIGGWLRMI